MCTEERFNSGGLNGRVNFDMERFAHFLTDEGEYFPLMETVLCCYARTMFQKIRKVYHEI